MTLLHSKIPYFVLLATAITSGVLYVSVESALARHSAATVLFINAILWALLVNILVRHQRHVNQIGDQYAQPQSNLLSFPKFFSVIEASIVQDLSVVKQEIRQIKGLVNDGVKTLSDSFCAINNSIQEQQKIIHDVTTTLPENHAESISSELTVKTDNIQENIANTIRSLQFEDIAVQVADNSIQYLDNVESFLQLCHDQLEHIHSSNSNNSQIDDPVQYFSQSVQQLRLQQLPPDRKAAEQQNLSAGEIELF